MSYLVATPGMLVAAATDVQSIGAALVAANMAAAVPITEVAAAGGDDISAAVASAFSAHAIDYQAVSAQARAFYTEFMRRLNAAAGAYGSAEATNATLLHTAQHEVLEAINAPTQALLGRPLIGNGSNGSPGTGADGG
ncbi:PE family protein, partial [Mycobacterium riyadhense]